MERTLGVFGFFASTILLIGCGDIAAFDQAREDFHYSYGLQPGGTLDLTNRNGSVEIVGWDRNTIDVSGTKYASDESALKAIQVKVNADGKNATIDTSFPDTSWHGSYGVRYRIRVPRKVSISRAETTNGSVTLEDLEGGGRVRSTNGKLSLTRLTGDYDLHTTNGSISIDDSSGITNAQTTNGSVRGRLKEGAMTAHSTNGAIDLTVDHPAAGKSMRFGTTNGSITLALAEFHDNGIRAETTHGSVTLRLPGDTNARLDADTSLAGVSTELPLSSVDEQSKHSIRGKIGNGGPEISAHTSTGSIRIQRF